MISRTKSAVLLGIAAAAVFAGAAHAQTKPITTCDAAGIGAAKITVDKPARILEAAPATDERNFQCAVTKIVR